MRTSKLNLSYNMKMEVNMSEKFANLAQGEATPANPSDISKDEVGITNPNLHRRIEADVSILPDSQEVAPREYKLGVYGRDSYRTTSLFTHDEESDSEIP